LSQIQLYNEDCLIGMQKLESNSLDSIVTDPPYEIGFMGKAWDNTGIAYNIDLWKECLRVLKPGGHLLAFGGTRTYHRLACAIEDAGFEIRDQIQWIYGSGFPKSLNISKAIDKRPKMSNRLLDFSKLLKSKRKELNLSLSEADKLITGGSTMYSFIEGRNLNGNFIIYPPNREYYNNIKKVYKIDGWDDIVENNLEIVDTYKGNFGYQQNNERWEKDSQIVNTTTDEAKQWDGWGTALKPANEPIVVARKPLSEKTVAENVLKWGTGGLNIDACRVEFKNEQDLDLVKAKCNFSEKSKSIGFGTDKTLYGNGITPLEQARDCIKEEGRFPANVILDEEAGKLLDEQSGIKNTTRHMSYKRNGGEFIDRIPSQPEKDWFTSEIGGASRFFYCAKASKKERGEGNTHPTVKPISLMQYLINLVTPLKGTVCDPFLGSGTTGVACLNTNRNFIGFELDEKYFNIAQERISKHQASLNL
jgi:DNA modification methylase